MERGEVYPRSDDISVILELLGNITYDELFETNRFSVYIGKVNNKFLDEYKQQLDDIFPVILTDYEKKSILVNCILKVFLEKNKPEEIVEQVKSMLDNS